MVSRTRPARAVIVRIWMSDHLRSLLRNAVDVLPQGALEKRLAEAAEAIFLVYSFPRTDPARRKARKSTNSWMGKVRGEGDSK